MYTAYSKGYKVIFKYIIRALGLLDINAVICSCTAVYIEDFKVCYIASKVYRRKTF